MNIIRFNYLFFGLLFITSCTSANENIKYYANIQGANTDVYNGLPKFLGLIVKKEKPSFYYKVSFTKKDIPIKAELYIGSENKGKTLFDIKGRIIHYMNPSQNCNVQYNDSLNTRLLECFKVDGSLDYKQNGFYKENYLYKTIVYDGSSNIKYYVVYDRQKGIGKKYKFDGSLIEEFKLLLID